LKSLRARAAVPLAGLLAVVVAGCSSSASATSTPTKASYDKQANAICKTFNAKLSSVGAELKTSTQQAQVEQGLETAISLAQQGTNKLEGLRRPAGETGALAATYRGQEGQVTDFRNLLTAVEANSASQVQTALATAQASSGPLNQKFDALGLTVCGSGSSPTSTA
jgi:hypothetical protein